MLAGSTAAGNTSTGAGTGEGDSPSQAATPPAASSQQPPPAGGGRPPVAAGPGGGNSGGGKNSGGGGPSGSPSNSSSSPPNGGDSSQQPLSAAAPPAAPMLPPQEPPPALAHPPGQGTQTGVIVTEPAPTPAFSPGASVGEVGGQISTGWWPDLAFCWTPKMTPLLSTPNYQHSCYQRQDVSRSAAAAMLPAVRTHNQIIFCSEGRCRTYFVRVNRIGRKQGLASLLLA